MGRGESGIGRYINELNFYNFSKIFFYPLLITSFLITDRRILVTILNLLIKIHFTKHFQWTLCLQRRPPITRNKWTSATRRCSTSSAWLPEDRICSAVPLPPVSAGAMTELRWLAVGRRRAVPVQSRPSHPRFIRKMRDNICRYFEREGLTCKVWTKGASGKSKTIAKSILVQNSFYMIND